MRHAVADKRVFCHETFAHYTTKLQHPLHEQDVEAWSDSESSDEGGAEHDLLEE